MKIDRKLEFATDSNETSGDICTWDWAGVPSVDEEEDCFEGDSDAVTFVGHDLETFVEKVIDTFD
jgi:hypothetical protein